jgi:site-specific recombinase
VSLGLMLGILPALAAILGLGLEVRHVTLSTGQLAAALGALGWELLRTASFWGCVATVAGIGLINLGVSFWFAWRLALRSRGIRVAERQRIGQALRWRLRSAPLSFLLPPRA